LPFFIPAYIPTKYYSAFKYRSLWFVRARGFIFGEVPKNTTAKKIPLAKEIKEAGKRGESLNLDFRELAFYDALEVNDSAVKILGDEKLQTITRDLLESVRSSTTIDWTIKESVQATLRRNIRRILRKHGYPPDLQERAVQTVIDQAKLLANDLVAN